MHAHTSYMIKLEVESSQNAWGSVVVAEAGARSRREQGERAGSGGHRSKTVLAVMRNEIVMMFKLLWVEFEGLILALPRCWLHWLPEGSSELGSR